MSTTMTDRAAQRRQEDLRVAQEAGRRAGARLASTRLSKDQRIRVARVLGGDR